ncbi:MAG: hypothetical protein LBQ79_05595 [Deltaproteobacteria bacterium]|nr:hypothetical protein [Deltaproteobacteria bacterium]
MAALSGDGRPTWRELSEICGAFGEEAAARALAFFRATGAKGRLARALARTPPAPEICGAGWDKALGFLTGAVGAPEGLCESLRREGKLASDRFGSALFICEGGGGAFRMGFPGASAPRDVRHPRSGAAPFVIGGDGPAAVVCGSPAVALLVKARDAASGVMVLGRFSEPRLLLPHLEAREIRLAGSPRSAPLARISKFLALEGMAFTSFRPPAFRGRPVAGGVRREARP